MPIKKHLFTRMLFAFFICLNLSVQDGTAAQTEQTAFFRDLSPMIGDWGRVRAFGGRTGDVFTGDESITDAGHAFVWTKKDGYRVLPFPLKTKEGWPPENFFEARGMKVSDNGKVVAGLICHKDHIIDYSRTPIDYMIVWNEDEEPIQTFIPGARIAGVTPDGSGVVAYSTLGWDEPDKDDPTIMCFFRIMGIRLCLEDKAYYSVGDLYPGGDNHSDFALLLGGDGKTVLIGEEYNGKYLIDLMGNTRLREFGLGGIPYEFPKGTVLGGRKMNRGRVHKTEVHTINYDGSVAAGRITVLQPLDMLGEEHVDFVVYWDKDGKIHFMDSGSTSKTTFVDDISDDGNTMLLDNGTSYSLWRKGKGITPLKKVFEEYGIDTGGMDAGRMTLARMSRDGKYIAGAAFAGQNSEGRDLFKPFLACFGK